MKWALALGFFLAYRGGPGLKPAEHPIQQGWMGTRCSHQFQSSSVRSTGICRYAVVARDGRGCLTSLSFRSVAEKSVSLPRLFQAQKPDNKADLSAIAAKIQPTRDEHHLGVHERQDGTQNTRLTRGRTPPGSGDQLQHHENAGLGGCLHPRSRGNLVVLSQLEHFSQRCSAEPWVRNSSGGEVIAVCGVFL